jgi:hypothetical protein
LAMSTGRSVCSKELICFHRVAALLGLNTLTTAS